MQPASYDGHDAHGRSRLHLHLVQYHLHRAEAAARRYLTDYYTDEAVKAIKANANRPFFLYLAHWGAHAIVQLYHHVQPATCNVPHGAQPSLRPTRLSAACRR